MSLWQFNAAVGGHVKAHTVDDGAITSEQAAALAAALDEKPVWH